MDALWMHGMNGGRPVMHSQVMKVKEEDQQIGQEVRTRLSNFTGLSPTEHDAVIRFSSSVPNMFFLEGNISARPACRSPLGLKPRAAASGQ